MTFIARYLSYQRPRFPAQVFRVGIGEQSVDLRVRAPPAFLQKEASNPHHSDVGVSAVRKDE